MATPTYDALATTTLTAASSSVTFSNLNTVAAGYRDLVVVGFAATSGDGGLRINFNGQLGSAYKYVTIFGRPGGALSSRSSGQSYIQDFFVGTSGNVFYNQIWQIFDFAETDKFKTVLLRNGDVSKGSNLTAGIWESTSAITSLTLTNGGYNFNVNSTFSIYGVKA